MPGNPSDSLAQEDVDKENQPSSINRELIQHGVVEIKRSYSRSRKVRVKLLTHINLYFSEIANMLTDDGTLASEVVDYIRDFKELIVESTNLCISLSHPTTRIHEIYGTVYDLGIYIEQIVMAVFTWCSENSKLFGEVVVDLLEALIKISGENPESWLYSTMISALVLHIVNAFCDPSHEKFRRKWALGSLDLMKEVSKGVFKCGDFCCQYYLMQFISAWMKWTSGTNALSLINSVFSFVDANARKQLMMEADVDVRLRRFLNSLNLSLKGPNFVIPISCSYLFICDQELFRPEHMINLDIDFWVDFSIGSGRIHTFYSFPESGASLLSLSIRSDQVDSVCLNWVVNDGSQVDSEETRLNSQRTSSTFMKDEKVLFFHVVLNVDFDAISVDVDALLGKGYRSMYFVFRSGERVEKVMKEMGFHQHLCGSMNCERPRTLRQLLKNQNNLRYSKVWCPESQVFGLDESKTSESGRSSRRVSPNGTPRSCSSSCKSATPRSISQRTPRNSTMLLKSPNSTTASSRYETGSAFYVSDSSQDDDSVEDDISVNRIRFNATCNTADTSYEDPLPRSARKGLSSNKSIMRNSTPIPERMQAPFSPPVSVIFDTSFESNENSPQRRKAGVYRRSLSPEFEYSEAVDIPETNKNDSNQGFHSHEFVKTAVRTSDSAQQDQNNVDQRSSNPEVAKDTTISSSQQNKTRDTSRSISPEFQISGTADGLQTHRNDDDPPLSSEFSKDVTMSSSQQNKNRDSSRSISPEFQLSGTADLLQARKNDGDPPSSPEFAKNEAVNSPQQDKNRDNSRSISPEFQYSSAADELQTRKNDGDPPSRPEFARNEAVNSPQQDKNRDNSRSISLECPYSSTTDISQADISNSDLRSLFPDFGRLRTANSSQQDKNCDRSFSSPEGSINTTANFSQQDRSRSDKRSISPVFGFSKIVDVVQSDKIDDDPRSSSPNFENVRSECSYQKKNYGDYWSSSPASDRIADSPQLDKTREEKGYNSPELRFSGNVNSPNCSKNGSDRSASMSPVFGYSRTLVDEPVGNPHSSEPASMSLFTGSDPILPKPNRSHGGKVPCYANACEEMEQRRKLKLQESGNYDPYDPLTCTEFEEFRNHIFPKLKTYARKMKTPRKAQTKAKNRKRVTLPTVNDDYDSDFQQDRTISKRRKTESSSVGPRNNSSLTSRKYISFSKSRA
ncbi:unnamed protein product [Orchesella dallaii]|uniref:Uncharacterized protein n=1 Tax=Orchesella dallaii TaxID=48710 RepID=A0ABP1S3J1_9HEXA